VVDHNEVATDVVGDPVPAGLAAHYAARDARRVDDAVAAVGPAALYAVPRPGAPETDARRIVEGRNALRGLLTEREPAPHRHEIQLCVHDGDRALVEGVTRSTATGAAEMSFAAAVSLDAEGRIARYVGFGGAPAPDLTPHAAAPTEPTPNGTARPADMDTVLHEYFAALDRGDFAGAAARFSPDVLYVHPPYRHTGIDSPDRVTFRGRAALLAAFTARGRQSFDHRVTTSIQRGPHGLIEGVVQGLPGGGTGSFVSSLTLDAAGLIRRYVSFYCEPAVPGA